jgi:hypothetical protein
MFCTTHARAAYRKYHASLARGNALFFRAVLWQELDPCRRRAVLVLYLLAGKFIPQIAARVKYCRTQCRLLRCGPLLCVHHWGQEGFQAAP